VAVVAGSDGCRHDAAILRETHRLVERARMPRGCTDCTVLALARWKFRRRHW
jgi:hypothetical protein